MLWKKQTTVRPWKKLRAFIIFVANISRNIKIHANTTEPVKP
jgi:hypothetical protein